MRKLLGSAIAASLLGGLSMAGESPGLVAIKLDTLWRVKTEAAYGIVIASQAPGKATVDRALYYIPAAASTVNGQTLPGLEPLYRLLDDRASDIDDLESTTDSATGYTNGGTLGFLWRQPAAAPGLVPVLRARRAGGARSGSHTLVAAADSLHARESVDGYAPEVTLGYAYPRYADSERLIPVSGGGVTVKSNANAGGAVWEWWWEGKQFINDYDNGRQLSTALYTEAGNVLEEAGDGYGGREIPLYARHPCPTLYVRSSGNGQQSSRAMPLEWAPTQHSGGKENPVIYVNAKIGKEITLNWRGPDNLDRNWPVVLYESVYEGPPFPVASVEAPTAYLNAEFNTYYKYDATKDTLTPISTHHGKVDISAGTEAALIIAQGAAEDAIAMGVYMNDPNAGIVLYDNTGPDDGKYGSSFSKWGVVFRTQVSAVWKFRTWIVTDLFREIRKVFHQLHLWGVTSRDR